MCTVTVLRRQHAMTITMNRDEKTTRVAEQPPQLWPHRDLTAPRDGPSGGTWIGMNARGDWACVLNSYDAHTPLKQHTSRGGIIPALLMHPDTAAVLATMDLTCFPPFRIMHGDAHHWKLLHWNGRVLLPEAKSESTSCDYFISSSSWNTHSVVAARNQAFARWQKKGCAYDDDGIPIIHRWQEKGAEATAVLMRRAESLTTSLTQIMFRDGATAVMRYWPADRLVPTDCI